MLKRASSQFEFTSVVYILYAANIRWQMRDLAIRPVTCPRTATNASLRGRSWGSDRGEMTGR
eukprot:6205880-Pleurochrysis_carterae.AAC.1